MSVSVTMDGKSVPVAVDDAGQPEAYRTTEIKVSSKTNFCGVL